MMIKITESCSMGCSHCMNDAKPCNSHMTIETFRDALNFMIKNSFGMALITGGEPTEHPHFKTFLEEALEDLRIGQITVTTNGVWLQDNIEYAKMIEGLYRPRRCFWQVTSDKRFYPTQIDLDNPVFSLQSMVICEKIERVYPQGRAKANNLPWQSKASKCFNIRAITRQLYDRQLITKEKLTVQGLCKVMMSNGYFCTPHIDIYGNIKLGESDLCPVCASIYDTESVIIQKILNFRCKQCEFINKNLPDLHRHLIGEK